VAVTIRLTPAEFACFDAIRSSEALPRSQADWLMEFVMPTCERLAKNARLVEVRRRCASALQAYDAEREKHRPTGAGRPPRPRSSLLS
jgi:hypothetical protein